MPTIHTWRTSASGFPFDPTHYVDGTAFTAGDTLVLSDGALNAANGALYTGNYQINATGASVGFNFINISTNSATSISVAGPLTLQWLEYGTFVNNGTLSVGTSSSKGNLFYNLFDNNGRNGSFTNNGTISLQNVSGFNFYQGLSGNGNFVNASTALFSISSGSAFYSTGNPFSEDTGSLNLDVKPIFQCPSKIILSWCSGLWFIGVVQGEGCADVDP